MDYLDFEIEVAEGPAGAYAVRVLRSPAGEASGQMRLPFDGLALQNRLQALQIALLRSGGTRRRVETPESRTVQAFGQELWTALFSGDILALLEATRHEARRRDAGVRIKLRFESPTLAALPWEYLYDASRGDYVTLSAGTPLVRYIPLPQQMSPLEVTPPLRILGLAISPSDMAALDLDRERQRLDLALADLRVRGLVELEWATGGTWRDLQQMLWKGPWHVFHFIGHGGFDENRAEGLVVFQGEDGKSQYLSATNLGRLLGDHDPLRLAILNACESARGDQADVFSSTAAALVRRGTPAVVAMQYEITDVAAIEFSRSFYEAVASGIPVDAALAEARKGVAMALPDTLEWGTPVLFMRAPDGELFDIPPIAPAKVPDDAVGSAAAGLASGGAAGAAEDMKIDADAAAPEVVATDAGDTATDAGDTATDAGDTAAGTVPAHEPVSPGATPLPVATPGPVTTPDPVTTPPLEMPVADEVSAPSAEEPGGDGADPAGATAAGAGALADPPLPIASSAPSGPSPTIGITPVATPVPPPAVAPAKAGLASIGGLPPVALVSLVAALGIVAIVLISALASVVAPGPSPSPSTSARVIVPPVSPTASAGPSAPSVAPSGAAASGSPGASAETPTPTPTETQPTPTPTPTSPVVLDLAPTTVGFGILFQNDGDGDDEIYHLDPVSGQVDRLTRNGEHDRLPNWSYDGRFIAFTRGGDIWTMDRDGSDQHPITTGRADDRGPSWSPDGTQIVFSSNRDERDPGDHDLFIVMADGTAVIPLTGVAGADDRMPSWSPDGRFVAFTSDRTGVRELYVVEVDPVTQAPGAVTPLTSEGVLSRNPTWAPDGSTIIYARQEARSPRDIWALDLFTGIPRAITDDPADEGNPVYAPDGTYITFYRRVGEVWHLLIARADGSEAIDMTASLDGSSIDPSWR